MKCKCGKKAGPTGLCQDCFLNTRSSLICTSQQGFKEYYMQDINRLVNIAKELPKVEHRFVLEVASMPREELQRRVLTQADWLAHFYSCLDGIKEITVMPGSGVDGCRGPDEIRNIVKSLAHHSTVTWEKNCFGELKSQEDAIKLGWSVGDTLRFPPYKNIWKVEQVVERGLVISLSENSGHRHLVEWSEISNCERVS